jgi:hypothetical protein
MDAMFDRMDAVGKSVLGLTIQCAQCHTHKFDLIQYEEYCDFRYLNNDHEAQRVVYTPEEQMKAPMRVADQGFGSGIDASSPDWETKPVYGSRAQTPVK